MRIAFKFQYIHDNALFARLLERVREKSDLSLCLYEDASYHVIEASGDQGELEALAELVSPLIPQSLFLLEHQIEEVNEECGNKLLEKKKEPYSVPYCPECQHRIMRSYDPFQPCNVCGFSDSEVSLEQLNTALQTDFKSSKELFSEAAAKLIEDKELSLMTHNGIRTFSLLGRGDKSDEGIMICDPSELSSSFLITQDELDTLMMIEKPSMRLKPKLTFRAENDLQRAFYPVFFADDTITLALSLALSDKGVFAVYCDQVPALRTASALQEHVIINEGRDMLPWQHHIKLDSAAVCNFEGFTAYGDKSGLLLDKSFVPQVPSISYISKDDLSSEGKGVYFEPSHAALRSVALEHDLETKPLCGIYLSRQHDSQICSYSSKIGYTALADFINEVPAEGRVMLASIAQMDDAGRRLVENYKREYSKLYETVENASFSSSSTPSMLTRLWAMAALFIGLSEGGDIDVACEQLESTAIEFNGKSGPRIDYKVTKGENSYKVDPRLAIRSAMSFKLAGVDEYLLSFGFIDSLADFIGQQAEMTDANIGIEGVTLCGSLFENRQLLMRTYNALSPNYTIYRNKRLPIDGANIAIGAITLGRE